MVHVLFDSFKNWKEGHWDNTEKCVTVINAGDRKGQWRAAKNCSIDRSPYVCKMDPRKTDDSTTAIKSVLETTTDAMSTKEEIVGDTFAKSKKYLHLS